MSEPVPTAIGIAVVILVIAGRVYLTFSKRRSIGQHLFDKVRRDDNGGSES